jgi:CHAT domain-containing protein
MPGPACHNGIAPDAHLRFFMPTHPISPRDAAADDLLAVRVLLEAWQAYEQGEQSIEDLFALADQRELAEAATPASCAAFTKIVTDAANQLGRGALLFAAVVEAHASRVDDLGRCQWVLGLYAAIVPLFEQHAPPELLAGVLSNHGNALQKLGRLDQAVAAYDAAIAIREDLVHTQGRRELANDLAAALMNKGNALQALGRLDEADKLVRGVDPALFGGVDRQKYHSILGDRCWDRGEHEQALEHYAQGRAALRLARRTAGIDETWLEYQRAQSHVYQHYVGRALECGRLPDALETIQEAKASVLGDLRGRLNRDVASEPPTVATARRRLLDWLRDPPRELTAEGWRAERNRQIEEYLKTCRLARSPRPMPTDPVTDQPVRVGDIQEHLAPGWAVLDFWRTANEEVTVFVLTRNALHVERLRFPVEDQRFVEQLGDLQASLANPLDQPHDEALRELYLQLFFPLRKLLSRLDVHRLYLVPHGYLHHLPLHACWWKEKGQLKYLGDEFDIAYLPSAALLTQLPPPRRDSRFFSLANPLPHSPRTLPFSEYEGGQLRRRYGGNGRFHLGKDGTYARTDHWSDAAIVHFSCHGYGDPSFAPLSFLELQDDWLLAHDVVNRRPALQEGALVLLNGCQTSVRDVRAVDEGFGLMSAFLLRGAGLVLATQWSVIDACANRMLLTFLDRYLAGAEPVAALRQAQRQIRELPPDAILRHCEEVLAQFPETSRPYEVINICVLAVRVCKRTGRLDDARDWFQKIVSLHRQLGQPLKDEEKQYAQLKKDAASRAEAQWRGPANFDHPVFWSAFQLVGRVV